MNEKVSIKERLKSWAVWVSVLGALGVILNATGVFELIGLDSMQFDIIVNAVGTILIAFGILNNPTNKTGF
ncbi:MAG: hypothetical protein IJA39_03825 [Clostridia bacterium]|nr:hypothetical protein [Clostridia bacterium]